MEAKFKLGPWVATQRYRKDLLAFDRKRRLDAIGFVWDWRDLLWDRGFTALLKFKQREGHCRVPASHNEGNYKLGYWVSTQRRYKKVYKKEMSTERKARLNKIDFVWIETKGPTGHRAGPGTGKSNEVDYFVRRSRQRNSGLVVEKH